MHNAQSTAVSPCRLPHYSNYLLPCRVYNALQLPYPSCLTQCTNIIGELKTGYLEKRVGEHSGRQSVPLGESFKWQKRYFVLTEPKGMLYYFKSADDPPNYRGVINLRCVPAYTQPGWFSQQVVLLGVVYWGVNSGASFVEQLTLWEVAFDDLLC